jgi:glycosyltransferase involved in cell wall biosynthesis
MKTDPPVRLLLNGLHSKSGGGVTYLRNLLPLFAKNPQLDVHLCIQEDQRSILPAEIDGVSLHTIPSSFGFWRVQAWEQFLLPRLAKRIGADVTFSAANYGPIFARDTVILIGNAINVAFVEYRPTKIVYWAAVYLGTVLSLATCSRAIAVSDYARRTTTVGFLRRFRDRIAVVHHGVDKSFSPPQTTTKREEFILAVSDIYVQKNLKNLLFAIKRLIPYHTEIRLKVAGSFIDMGYWNSVQKILKDENLENHVEFLGHISPENLVDLYRRCRVFVFPSLVETFGIPLLEAMASGAPIASSNTAAMPEVLDDSGVMFEPTDIDGIAVAINKLIRHPELCQTLSEKAVERASNFTWQKTAEKTISVIKEAAVKSRKRRERQAG